ncbi:MAG: FAD-dependent oxidoreductase [Acidobacteriota bacterium]
MPVTGETILSRVLMVREIDRLTARRFDVLVVGGGVYGLTIAYDAAQRGLSVALIEQHDFGAGTSFNHLRTIHGGLRYLQTLDIRRARESVRERATLARIASQSVRPLPFVLPISRSLVAGKMAMRAGFLLDRLVGFDRNRDVPDALRLPAGYLVSRDEAARRFPGLRRQGMRAAAVWHDYVTVESDRLTLSYALAANEHGAALANYTEATSLLVDGKRVIGVRARDLESGRELDTAARLTVNATGAALDRLLLPLGIPTGLPLLKAMNLVTSRNAGDEALGGRGPSGRTLFLLPWRGRALAGTWESTDVVASDARHVTGGEVSAFILELNQTFPALDLRLADVTLVHRGLVPAVRTAEGGLVLDGHERVRDHTLDGIEGLLSVAGTKYTTARAVAERVVDRAIVKLGGPPSPCRTATTRLPGGLERDFALTIADARREDDGRLAGDTLPHLVAAYGSRYRDILDCASKYPEWRTRIADSPPVIGAELIWAVRHEMARTLADAVIRRTPLGVLGCPSDASLESAAAIVGNELGWTDGRRRAEIAAVKRFYDLSPARTVDTRSA